MFSTDGIIQSDTTNNTFVQCSTTHLTSFAVLVDTSGVSANQPCALCVNPNTQGTVISFYLAITMKHLQYLDVIIREVLYF